MKFTTTSSGCATKSCRKIRQRDSQNPQIIAKVTMKVAQRVVSKTSEACPGTSRRVARRERLKPKTRSLKASRRWVKRAPKKDEARRGSASGLLLETAGSILQQYHGGTV